MELERSEVECPARPEGQRLLLAKAPAAAKVLGISTRTLWDLTQRGEIACIRIGRSVRYSTDYLEEWVRSRARQIACDRDDGDDNPQLPRDASVRR